MTFVGGDSLGSAINDFRRARFRATLEQVVARLRGESIDLLEYEQVRKQLKANSKIPRGLQDIAIDSIVGSVDRYTDFTRSFLPRQDQDEGRWARVKRAMTDMAGLPPIEVYQIGEAYFVADGNHRVSVAREMGASHIQAYVTEIDTNVSLSPDVDLKELILKVEYAEFVERTGLDRCCPAADLSVSIPGQYQKLEEHISAHRYFMGIDRGREVSQEEAVEHWYCAVYMPVIEIIRERGILRDFPDRTEADLYLWILDHRVELGKELHWEISPEAAANDLVERYSGKPERVVARVGSRISDVLIPDAIKPGPPAGSWREQVAERREDRLFSTILVGVSGVPSGWGAVQEAIRFAAHEGGHVVGLHIVADASAAKEAVVGEIRAEFERRCAEAGIAERWLVEQGSISLRICAWSRWVDLTVVPLNHPPGDQPIARLSSGLTSLIEHCATPILAVPRALPALERVLLAYDGSPKSREALFVSAYLAGQWDVELVVVTVTDQVETEPATLAEARAYLERHDIAAEYASAKGHVGENILAQVEKWQCDLVVMGGYGFSPPLEIMLGSAVDQVLRKSQQPVLICR